MSIQRRLDELEERRDEATGPNTVDTVGELLPATRCNDDVELSPRLRSLVPDDSENWAESTVGPTESEASRS